MRSTCEGTRRVLEFAERCQARGGLRRLSHISTAYVAGEHAGCFSEDDLDVGQRFRNAYEQSKFEAERLVAGCARAAADHGRCARASSSGSATAAGRASFNVLYWPLRAFSRGTYLALPARGWRARGRRAGRLRRRRHLRAQPGPRGRGRDLPPHRRRAREQRRRARRARDRVLRPPGAAADRARRCTGVWCTRCSCARAATSATAARCGAARCSSPTSRRSVALRRPSRARGAARRGIAPSPLRTLLRPAGRVRARRRVGPAADIPRGLRDRRGEPRSRRRAHAERARRERRWRWRG